MSPASRAVKILQRLQDAEAGMRYTYDLLGTRETKISRPQDVKKINQIFLNYIGITIVINLIIYISSIYVKSK